MTMNNAQILTASTPSGDTALDTLQDSVTNRHTSKVADIDARASLVSILAKIIAAPSTEATLAGAATSLVSILAKLPAGPALDATLSAGITSIVNAIAATQTVTGTVTANLGTLNGAATQTTLAAVLTQLQASIAITAAALPLPTGAATGAKQDTGNTSLATLAGIVTSNKAATTLADGDSVSLGAKADTAATTDTGTFSLIALFKRMFTPFNAMVTSLASLVTNTAPGTSGPLASASAKCVTTSTDDAFLGPSISSALFGPQSATGVIVPETDVSPYAGAYVDISGIATATIQFSGGNFTGALKTLGTCQPTDTPTISPPVSSVTTNKMLWIPFGFKYFSANVSAWTSGAISIRIQYVLKGTPVPVTFMQQITPAPTVSVGPATFFRGQNVASTGSPTNVKSTAAIVCSFAANNANASTDLYLQLYNKGSAPVLGTDTPNLTYRVKAGTTLPIDFGAFGARFSNGFGYAFTSDYAGSTGVTTAADGTVTGLYA